MVRGPEMKLLASHSGGAVRSTSSIRESTSTSMASISMRAMCAFRAPGRVKPELLLGVWTPPSQARLP